MHAFGPRGNLKTSNYLILISAKTYFELLSDLI